MHDCPHCEESFDEEEAYLSHLGETHPDELGPIDRRRVDEATGGDDGGPPVLAIAVGLVGVVCLAAAGYLLFSGGGGAGGADGADGSDADVARTPTNVGSTDFHGTIVVVVDGERVDFSRSEYQLRASAFHFENGNGQVWHGHADGITLEYAMSTLGIGVTDSTVRFEGTTYRDSTNGTSVSVTVDGEPVDPRTYVLQGVANPNDAGAGDAIRIVVETDG